MKRPVAILLLAALCGGIGMAGCSSEDTAAPATAKTETVQTTDEKITSTPSNTAVQSENDPSIAEVRDVFKLDSTMRQVSSVSITAIATGDLELGLEQKERIELAKSLSRSLGEIGWKQEDFPPGIFLSADSKKFAIGFKHKNGDYSMNTYEVQGDGTFKNVKTEDKKADAK